MIDYDVEVEQNQSLDHKLALAHLALRLKHVLNPTPCSEAGSFYKIVIDESITFPIQIRITFLTEDNKSIDLIAHIDENDNISGILLGQELSLYLNILNNSIYVGSEALTINYVNAEVFHYEDTKNHILSINLISTEDLLDELSISEIENNIIQTHSDFTFAYKNKDGYYINVLSGNNIEEIYDSFHSELSETTKSLYADVPIVVLDVNGQPIGLSTGVINQDLSSAQITLDLNLPEEYVLPMASSSQLGGIKLSSNGTDLGSSNRIPLQLTIDGKAYIEIPDLDIHRFSDMNSIPSYLRKSGMIVEYIGPNSSQYTKGYFYQFTPTVFQAAADPNEKWMFANTANETGLAIADYNVFVDYLITEGDLTVTLNLAAGESSITNNTLFNLVQNNVVLAEHTYLEIKDLFKIEIKPLYISLANYSDYVMALTIPNNGFAWKQKNVQPMMKVGSSLTYKGPITWDQLQLITNPETGDYYTVTDRSNQEWFWTGTEWEYMGEVITVPEYMGTNHITVINHVISDSGLQETLSEGNGISITSNTVSVKYDNSTIKKNQNGDLYVDGVLTDTTYTAGTGLLLNGTEFKHSNSITSGTAQGSATKTLSFGDTFDIPSITYDSEGHITAKGTTTMTMPSAQVMPTVNDNKLTIQGNGTAVVEFTANSSSDKTLNIKGSGLISISKTNDGEITVSTTATDNTGTITQVGNTTSGSVSVTSSNNTASFGSSVTVGTVGGVDLKFTMPTNPNTDTQSDWNETNTSSAAYILNKPTIPTVNDATYSVKTDVSGTETTVSDFTANQSTADSVTFVQGTNVTLTPDATNKKITIAATDTTYNIANSSTAGLVKSQTTGTTSGRDYNVEVNSNGTMKVNVPWTDTIPTTPAVSAVSDYITVDGNGGATNISTYVPVGAIQMYAGSTAPDGWLICNGDFIASQKVSENYQTESQTILGKTFTDGVLQSIVNILGQTYGYGYIYSDSNNGFVATSHREDAETVDSWTNNIISAKVFSTTVATFKVNGIHTGLTEHLITYLPDLQQNFPLGAKTSGTIGKYFDDNTWKSWDTDLGKTGGESVTDLYPSNLPAHAHSLQITGTASASKKTVSGDSDKSINYSSSLYLTQSEVYNSSGTRVDNYYVSHNNTPQFIALNFIIKY